MSKISRGDYLGLVTSLAPNLKSREILIEKLKHQLDGTLANKSTISQTG